MGKLNFNSKSSLSRSEYINKQTKQQFDKLQNNSYSRFMESAPIFATYYKQSTVESTTDKGLGTVETNIGFSGKKFVKIKHVPIYGLDKSSLNIDKDDYGIHGSFTTEGNLTQDTVKPIAEDYITFEFQDGKYLFKITNVDIDTILSNNYYKISIKFDRETPDKLENQIVDNFTTLFDNIGSEDKSIIQDDDFVKLKKFESMYENMCECYFEAFYNELGNCFTYSEYDVVLDEEVNYYDPYLLEFIIRNRLFEFDNSLTSYVFQHSIETPRDFLKRYKKSIFYNIFNKKPFSNNVRKIRIQDTLSYLYRSGDIYYSKMLYVDPNDPIDLFNEKYTTFDYNYTGENVLFNIVLQYLGIENKVEDNVDDSILCEIELDKKKITGDDYIINNLEDFYCEQNSDYFIFVPLVLFILKTKINNITVNIIK